MLTDEDREALRGLGQGQVPAVVEQIVARHVTAVLTAAAAELDRRARGGTAFNHAANIVRGHIPT